MFDVAVSFRMPCAHPSRGTAFLESGPIPFNASFIVGGPSRGAAAVCVYAEGSFIKRGTGRRFYKPVAKYGKPIIDRVIAPSTTLTDATKCVLVSFDSTMRSNMSVGMPIDLVCYERDSLAVRMRRRFDQGDAYFTALGANWSEGVRKVFRELPELEW
jgi:putative proteasome-type protease